MHYQVIELLKKHLIETESPLAFDLAEMDMDKACRMIFINYRLQNKIPQGKRLTDTGLAQLKTIFFHWDIVAEEKYLTAAQRLFMDRFLTMPYYIQGNLITFFEKTPVIEIKTAGNSIKTWMNMHKQA